MTKDKAKAEAEKIIQEFKPFVESEPFYSNKGGTIRKSIEYNATQCAIIHVKGILNLHTLEIGKGMMLSGCRNDSLHWQSILTELERK